MRPSKLVASAVLTAALALVALPGLAGSRTPKPLPSVEAAAFQTVLVSAIQAEAPLAIGPLDAAQRSAGALDESSKLIEPGTSGVSAPARAKPVQPASSAASGIKPPRYTMRGYASFYDAGFTAMRLPRGTIIRVCGPGGCLERTVTDYGPHAINGRIIDMYRPDFFRICGCPSWAGTVYVTVSVY